MALMSAFMNAVTVTTGVRPDGAPMLTAAGEFDMSNADTFAAALIDAVDQAGDHLLAVDLTAVEYLVSAGRAAPFERAERIRVVIGPLLAPLLEVSGPAELTAVDCQ